MYFLCTQTTITMKANDDLRVIKLIADLGLSFDCASKGEILKILSYGVPASRIVYANPVKQHSYIKYAAETGVYLMTFDNEYELHKIKACFPEAKLVLRILPPQFKATSLLGKKFGCPIDEVQRLLQLGKELQLNIVGISFHVGSGCMEAKAFSVAIREARKAYDIAEKLGFQLDLLDIGGGFPGHEDGLESFSEKLKIYLKKEKLCTTSTKASMPRSEKQLLYNSSLWGPTCDSVDLIMESCILPELDVGDWIYFENLGAYALSACSTFNGFPLIDRVYTCQKDLSHFL
ncbi:hypothetical protein KUTeg_015327 [Tegillarca granosa]|uniref:Ornithine decarboxylase n=1 Tax=Tegillarca granosa TaxID=220873 RepID=A0ABQ9EVB3_TEGGR|nr:hypothetical protein KUTeg_015327 [Tegillarca granosa]